jgi:mono/diheme cytochrome c family protein
MRKLLLLVGLVTSLTGCGSGGASGPSPLVSKGKALYDLNCKSCHGAEGHGDGPSAGVIKPPLHDFAQPGWMMDPSPETIKRVILEGIDGTQMPAFKSLSAADVDAIVAFTMTLTPKEPAPKPKADRRVPEFEKFGFTSIQPVKRAPGLDLFDAKNQPVSLEKLAGSWRVVHFWSKAGKGFEPDLKSIQKLADELKAVQFVVVGGDEHDPDELARVSSSAVNMLPLYAVKNQTGIDRYGVKNLPVTLIVDPEGNLIARKEGMLDESKLRELLTTELVYLASN